MRVHSHTKIVHVYAYEHTCTYTYTRVYTCTLCIHVYMHAYTCTYVRVYTHVHRVIYTYILLIIFAKCVRILFTVYVLAFVFLFHNHSSSPDFIKLIVLEARYVSMSPSSENADTDPELEDHEIDQNTESE